MTWSFLLLNYAYLKLKKVAETKNRDRVLGSALKIKYDALNVEYCSLKWVFTYVPKAVNRLE